MNAQPRTERREPFLGEDLALIAEAIIDAFRAMIPSPAESRWSKLRHSGCSF